MQAADWPEKEIGRFTCPAGDFGYQLKHIKKTGTEWASNMKSSSCPPCDAWLGLRYQPFPKLSYGLVSVSAPPAKLKTVFQSIYCKSLSSLKVDRNITKLSRTLPYKFQGLGLPNPNIEVLALKQHLIQNHWGTESEVRNFLQQAYETFQTELGLSGDMFALEYKRFQVLASDG